MSDDKPIDKRLKNLRPFKPGQSGNPGGRTKRGVDLRTLARQYTPEAVGRLVAILRDANASSMARVRAAEAILDRGWGKAVQPQAFTDIEGNDRPLVSVEDLTELDRARRIAFILAQGLRALPAQQPQLVSDSTEPSDQTGESHG